MVFEFLERAMMNLVWGKNTVTIIARKLLSNYVLNKGTYFDHHCRRDGVPEYSLRTVDNSVSGLDAMRARQIMGEALEAAMKSGEREKFPERVMIKYTGASLDEND